jgi:Na+-translocating ferredoxin:NAD+ oxidoreductase RNF subunit RnfB
MTTAVKEKNLKEIIEETQHISCPVQKTLTLLNEFMAGPMCGKCLPCPISCYEMAGICKNLSVGKGAVKDVEIMELVAPNMNLSSMCKKGKDTAKFIQDSLSASGDKFKAHTEGSCPDKSCKDLYVFRVIEENCTMCGECKEACKFDAIVGEKRVSYLSGYLPFAIIHRKCTKCGECIKACKFGAIEMVDAKAVA